MTKHNDVTGHYTNYFKGWQVKQLGPVPTASQLDAIHKLGARPGKQALANAMALRDCGVTGSQIVMACGAPQLNKMRGFIADGLLKREAVPADGKGHTVYKLTLTAKGNTRIGKAAPAAEAVTAKPVKAKKAKKVKQPKVDIDAVVAGNTAEINAQINADIAAEKAETPSPEAPQS